MPNKPSVYKLTGQITRSSTFVGTNNSDVCRAKSDADFINKLKIVEEETNKTIYWLEIFEETKLLSSKRIENVKKEAEEILAIVVASLKTMRAKNRKL